MGNSEDSRKVSFCLWAPGKLTWWIATLFMVGSSLFAWGSILFLQGYQNQFLNGVVFFIGSIFFTSAAYCQYYQSINTGAGPRKWFSWKVAGIGTWAALTQFVGTVLFNFNTFDAFLNLGWLGQDLLIWAPDILGSILFQVSGTLAMFEISRRWWCMKKLTLGWWIGIINFLGCVTFLISACLAFVTPHPLHDLAGWATVFTLLGAICFFVGSYLMLPELSLKTNDD